MVELPHLAKEIGVRRLWVKDEGINPTASFKARGLMMAVTRAKALKLPGVCVPTAGNAGIALAAYAAAAGMPCRIYAPETTPPPILGSIRAFGAELVLVDGHIGDAGKATMAFAKESGFLQRGDRARAVPRGGDEDDGLRGRRAVGMATPGCDGVSDRGRGRDHRHLEGHRRDARLGLVARRDAPAADDHRAGRGMRAAGAGLRGRRGEGDAVGESDYAREWAARARSAGGPTHAADVA
jgi:hypothetical protein